jgi:hypothetical protein
MKIKRNTVVFFPLLFLLLSSLPSCVMETPDNTGKLVVQNHSESAVIFITDVWTHQEGSLEWVSRWHGSKADGEEITLHLEPGSYDLKLKAEYLFIGQYFETGYKQPAVIKTGKTKFYIFDGVGIYDMEAIQ